MGRDRGRNEDNLLELKCLANFFRASEVTQMDGVESASKQPNPPTCGLFFDLSTLPILNPKLEMSNAKVQKFK